MTELTSMRNIGKEMARKLTAAGSKQAYVRLKILYPQVCLVHLYALEGAIRDVDYNRLPEETKADLKAFSNFLNGKGASVS